MIITEKKYGQLQIAVDVLRYQMGQLPADKIIAALKPLIMAFNNVSLRILTFNVFSVHFLWFLIFLDTIYSIDEFDS